MSEESTAVKVADVEVVDSKAEKDVKTMQDAQKVIRRALGQHQAKTSQSTKAVPKISTSSKPEDPKAKVCQISKMSKISTSNKPKDFEAMKIGQMLHMLAEPSSKLEDVLEIEREIREHRKDISKVSEEILGTTSETSTSIELETPKIPEVCQMSKTTSEMSTSAKFEACKIPKVCQITKTMSEMFTEFEAHEVPVVCQMSKTTSEMSTSAELEARKVPEVCQMSKTTSTSNKPKDFEAMKIGQMLHMLAEPSSKLEEVLEIEREIREHRKNTSKVSEEILETTSETSTSIELETPKIPEVCQMSKTTPEMSTSAEFESCKIPKVCEITKTMSEMSLEFEARKVTESQVFRTTSEIAAAANLNISDESEDSDPEMPTLIEDSDDPEMPMLIDDPSLVLKIPLVPEDSQSTKVMLGKSVPESKCTPECETRIPDVCDLALSGAFKPKFKTSYFSEIEEPVFPEVPRTRSMSKISASDKTEKPEVPEVPQTSSTTSQSSVPIKLDDFEDLDAIYQEINMKALQSLMTYEIEDNINIREYLLSKRAKDTEDSSDMPELEEVKYNIIKADNSEIPLKKKKLFCNETVEERPRKFEEGFKSATIYMRESFKSLSHPNFEKPHLILASHQMVPSLPIKLFEVLAEIIEVVTERPVALVHESRVNRYIATDVVDIVVSPTAQPWEDGVLLPASFVFEHRLNKTKSPGVYVDVIVADDHAPHIKDILDLREYMCALPRPRTSLTATGLLFNYLQSKGENVFLFGSTVGVDSQLEVLEMVASKRAEAGILESPVIGCHKNLHGTESIQILTTLGPLPPYRIMVKKTLANELNEKLTAYLLNLNKCEEWMNKLKPFGIIGFAENSMDNYNQAEKKKLATSVPYFY